MICKIKNLSFIPSVVVITNQDESQIQSDHESENHITSSKSKHNSPSSKHKQSNRMISPVQTQIQIEHLTKKNLKQKKMGIDPETDFYITGLSNKTKKVLSAEKLPEKQNNNHEETYLHKFERCTRNIKLLSLLNNSTSNIENLNGSFKSSQEYFKPKIVVEMSDLDDMKTVTEIHIKGWKIENPIMETLSICLPHVERLNTIKLLSRSFFFLNLFLK
jgi:hypothetical protein